jgi:deoxyribodipyrimidine photolyase-related protein
MKNYYDLLDRFVYKTEYIEFNKQEQINTYIKSKSIDKIIFFNPIEKELINLIMNNKIFPQTEKIMYPSPYFFNSTNFDINGKLSNELGSLRHDSFYKSQRIKLNIMVKKLADKFVPEGSTWSFDTANRKPFEKTQTEPEILHFKSPNRKEYLDEAVGYVEKNFSKHYGIINLNQFIYPINRVESIKWLEYFISNKLDNFGKYEDALSSKIKFGYHSVLSPLTNIGLITPQDIIEKVNTYKTNIASKEGFIRQVIGWREYCYFTYDLYGKYVSTNTLYSLNKYKVPKKVWECSTQIPPIDTILKNVTSNAYSHHIERLMGIGNFLILIETDPKEIYNWFQTMYIDAYDVFMVPNVYGMLSYGKLTESAHMMTRPYFASSNYLMKMSDYKSELCVEINNTKYKWDTIMNALYWSHIHKYSNEFKKIYATASGVARWEKFHNTKQNELIELAKLYKNWIHK